MATPTISLERTANVIKADLTLIEGLSINPEGGGATPLQAISYNGNTYSLLSTATVIIAPADWSGGTTCTKSVTGVTASNVVICDASDSAVSCTAQALGSLTFTATATPTASVTVKVVIFG